MSRVNNWSRPAPQWIIDYTVSDVRVELIHEITRNTTSSRGGGGASLIINNIQDLVLGPVYCRNTQVFKVNGRDT